VRTTTTTVDLPPEDVFAILADPDSYGEFVVGSRHIRDADPSWPAPGATFHHSLGVGVTMIRDHTTVVEAERPTRLLLNTAMGPLGVNRTEFRLQPDGAGTRIEFTEVPHEGLVATPVLAPLVTGSIWLRNQETLRRLKRLTRRRSPRS
jgi:uncharacterized protein YndB with AHSA1/START domain